MWRNGFQPHVGASLCNKEVAQPLPRHLVCLCLSLITCKMEIKVLDKCSDLNETDAIC